MNYWPLALFHSSPYMPAVFELELRELPRTTHLSRLAHQACLEVANRTAPLEINTLVISINVGGAANQLFIDYPEPEHWLRLERVGMIQEPDGAVYMMLSNLH